jgi:hypothetical protein
MAAFIPPDTVVLAGIQVDRLRETPLYRKLATSNRLPRFDSQNDITELLIANDGKNTLAIARGRFDRAAPGGFTRVDSRIALAGSEPLVSAAIARRKSGRSGAPAALLAHADALSVDPQIWAVVTGWPGLDPDTLRAMGNFANLNRVLLSTEEARLTIDLHAGVQAAFNGTCRSDAEATSLSESLRGLLGLARLSLPKNRPDLVTVFDAVQVKQEGRSVSVAAAIPEDLAEGLASAW